MKLSKMKQLSFKLPVFVAAMVILVATSLSVQTFLSGKASYSAQAMANLELLAAKRAQGLERWYEQLETTTLGYAGNPDIAHALNEFETNFARLDAEGRAAIQQAYTVLSPFEPGERDALDRAQGASFYHVAHERRHPSFRAFNERYGFYDTFLINANGDIVYSVFKENDFAASLVTGELANSGLAQVFRAAVNGPAGEIHFSGFDPYGPSNGAIAAFVAAPIHNAEGETVGVLAFQVDTENFAAVVNDPLGLERTGQAVLISQDLHYVVDSRFEDGPKMYDTLTATDEIQAALSGTVARGEGVQGLSDSSVSTVAKPINIGGIDYVFLVEISTDEILEDILDLRNRLILISIVSVGLVSLLIWYYIRSVTTAMHKLQNQMTEISDGDYTVEIASTERADELGDIGRTLVDFRSKLSLAHDQAKERERGQVKQQEVLEVLRQGLINLAEGDLSQPIETQFDEEYESLRQDFNETLRTLSEAISQVIVVSKSIQNGANEISQASDDLSNRTENQAATLEETAAALDELTASVRSAAEGAKSVEAIVVEAQSEAEESGKIVRDAIAAMTEIEKSSEHISQIIGVIDDIAFQTNLLALNAGVEAARAGEAGKGFAVVASEVRALAQRSSEAAKEIKTLISGSAKQVERGVELVGGAGSALGKIVERVTHISDLIRNMSNGSSEQAIGLGEINIGVNQLDQVTQQNAAMVEEATGASHVLKGDAEQLQGLVTRFKADKRHVDAMPQPSSNVPSDVIPVEFKHSKDSRADPTPIPMAVGDNVERGTSESKSDSDWIDF